MKPKTAFLFLIISSIIILNTSSAWAGWVSAPSMQECHGSLGGAVDKDGRIYAIGGTIDGKVERFDEHTGLWSYTTPLNVPRSYLGATTDSTGQIYAVGGFTYLPSTSPVNTVERFDPTTETWVSVADMNVNRAGAGVVADQSGRIYAIGGSDGSNSLSSVERYDPLLNQWDIITNLPTPRSYSNATLGPDGAIYAIGGYDGSSWLNSVLKYSSALDTWTEVAPISLARNVAASVTGPDGYIYAISGYNGSYTNIVERYDCITNSWSNVSPLLNARNNSGVVVTQSGYIYIFGGDIGYYRTDTVEKLYVVPEPATLLLLSLGGLIIRKLKFKN